MDKAKTGVLLINLGTPDGADKKSVRRYLKEFLDDARVIDLPWILRKALLHLFILPFRPARSLKAYQAIWDKDKGSPLLFHTKALTQELNAVLGSDFCVAMAMRYQNPNIQSALEKLEQAKCEKIIALPLFPQYSSAATGSAIENLLQHFKKKWNMQALIIQDKFYNDSDFIAAQAELIRPSLPLNDNTHLVLSYHSLPVRHIHKSKQVCQSSCFENNACPRISSDTAFCYRAQCYETSKLIAQKLGLKESQYTVAFQSRLGRTVWIGPDIQQVLPALRQKGIVNLVVTCPSFVADCLETIEEIGLRAKEQWHALGGGEFTLVPCLNAHPLWVKALATMINRFA